jgi:hypothetical protein
VHARAGSRLAAPARSVQGPRLTRSIPRLEMRFPRPHASSQDQGHDGHTLLRLVGITGARGAPLRRVRCRHAALRLCARVRWARQTPRAHVPARKREGTTRRPARRKTRRSERCSASRCDGVARQREQAATRRSRGLGRWGAHSRGSGVEPLPTRNLHVAKSGTQMSEARRALDAQHGGASRGDPRLETSAQRFGPHMMGCTAASSWVEARGTCRKM